MENLLREMRNLANAGKLETLTVAKAKQLKGKKIQTIYFGYAGQDGADEFVIGEIVKSHTLFGNQDPEFQSTASKKYYYDYDLLAEDGRQTFIRTNTNPLNPNNGVFWCSDSDRFVYFRLVEDEN